MAAKRNAPPPPPQSSSSESEEVSSEEEEEEQQQEVAKPSAAKPTQAAESSDEEDDDDEEEDEEEEKKPAKKPESEPDNKKLKVESSQSNQSNAKSKKVWTNEDEVTLMQAVSDFHSKNNRTPFPKEYGSLLETLKGKINPSITASQMSNKVRAIRDTYAARKKKGSDSPAMLTPHAKVIFVISEKLWGDKNKTPKKEEVPKKEEAPSQDASESESDDEDSEENDKHGVVNGDSEINNNNGGIVNNNIDGHNNNEKVKDECEFPYVIEAIEELSKANQGLFLFYKKTFESLDDKKARDFEARFEKIKYFEAKLAADNMELKMKLAKELAKMGK